MLEPGDKAPKFKVRDHEGHVVTLDDFKGRKLVVYFYPKDDTPGCTAEACNIRDYNTELRKRGFSVIGVSADDAKKHVKFAEKYRLPFPLIPDTEKKLINAFGVWGEKKFMGRVYDGIIRTTFIIDEKGVIEHRIDKVKTKIHSEQIIQLIDKDFKQGE